ncbi:hypothetical protein AVEN_73897-1 [Araneus ventricosus]|uniref:RNase H type-1 domain-containing protein n=1 Tax=Araneus ventricosus TaxID=182803 RepID=A0A4Y2VDD2_ARAVE|nr:hypothetical protein AVEN_73897-1 [Araneus ventricosus]
MQRDAYRLKRINHTLLVSLLPAQGQSESHSVCSVGTPTYRSWHRRKPYQGHGVTSRRLAEIRHFWNADLPCTSQLHTLNFLLHKQISLAENHIDSGAKAIYTDGSKTDGSAYCILENYGIIASWQGKLDHSNSFFQAEILAIKMAIEAASSLHRPIKIWTDSLSSLMAVLNPKSHHSIVREIQILLLFHKHINLRWLKAHVGYLGNECADQLAIRNHLKRRPFLST